VYLLNGNKYAFSIEFLLASALSNLANESGIKYLVALRTGLYFNLNLNLMNS